MRPDASESFKARAAKMHTAIHRGGDATTSQFSARHPAAQSIWQADWLSWLSVKSWTPHKCSFCGPASSLPLSIHLQINKMNASVVVIRLISDEVLLTYIAESLQSLTVSSSCPHTIYLYFLIKDKTPNWQYVLFQSLRWISLYFYDKVQSSIKSENTQLGLVNAPNPIMLISVPYQWKPINASERALWGDEDSRCVFT